MAAITRRSALGGLAGALWAGLPGLGLAEGAPPSPAGIDLDRGRAGLASAPPTMRGLVVARGGRTLFEHYRADTGADEQQTVNSVMKSVTAALIGIALGRGALRGLDQPIGEILPEAREGGIDPRVGAITVRHLLTMTSGFDPQAPGARAFGRSSLWRVNLRRPLAADPGAVFSYDNPASNLLTVILARATGRDALDFAREELFAPLGIANFSWATDGEGHPLGAAGLRLTVRDMAKIGMLFLAGGRWEGREIVPETFVAEAVRPQVTGGAPVGEAAYGYLWWIAGAPGEARAYFASGFGGQLVYVVPDRDVVVAIASDQTGRGGRRFINQAILPALTSM